MAAENAAVAVATRYGVVQVEDAAVRTEDLRTATCDAHSICSQPDIATDRRDRGHWVHAPIVEW